MGEIEVARQHDQIVPDADPGEQRIDGTHLNAMLPAVVAEFGCLNVVHAGGHDHRDCRKTVDNLRRRLRCTIPLKQLL